MTDVEFSKALSDLSATAAKLNRESDSINATISGFQDTLRKLNIGIEVWVRDALSSKPWTEDGGERRGTIDYKLGFVKDSVEWTLAVRKEIWQDRGDEWVVIEEKAPERLLEAPRSLRLKALELFPDLVRDLQAAAAEALKTIEQAKKFVK
jgi:hypothetical protein